MRSIEQVEISTMVKGLYDIQKLRIASGQRILAQTLMRLGLPQEIKEKYNETKEEKAIRRQRTKERNEVISEFLEKLGIKTIVVDEVSTGRTTSKSRPKKQTNFFQFIIDDYKGIIDYIVKNKGSVDKAIKSAGIGIISTQAEYEMIKAYNLLGESETILLKPLKRAVEAHPLWINFLKDVHGCGPLMAGVILSELDITKANYVSSFWKYAGLDTVDRLDEEGNPTGIKDGRTKKGIHQIQVEYTNKKGEDAVRNSITYNPFLKTKLVGVLGTCFLRSGGYYSEIYYGYRARLDNNLEHDGKSDGHKHAMAIRYMVKYFLQDTFVAWCLVEGRTPPSAYHVGKLGMAPHSKTSPALLPLLEKHKIHA